MATPLTASDFWPLILKLPHDERVRLAKLALRAAAETGETEVVLAPDDGIPAARALNGMPQVCRPGLRRHLYFGAGARNRAHVVFDFWKRARRGIVKRVLLRHGGLDDGNLDAPVGVYRHAEPAGKEHYVLIQHGSYQYVPVDEQPEIEAGHVLLHRGIGTEKTFRWWDGRAHRDAEFKSI